MKHTYKILDALTERNNATSKEMIDVHIQVFLGKKKLEVRRFGFDLETSEKAIRAELDRFVATLDADMESAAKNAEQQKQKENANKTINSLKGI